MTPDVVSGCCLAASNRSAKPHSEFSKALRISLERDFARAYSFGSPQPPVSLPDGKRVAERSTGIGPEHVPSLRGTTASGTAGSCGCLRCRSGNKAAIARMRWTDL